MYVAYAFVNGAVEEIIDERAQSRIFAHVGDDVVIARLGQFEFAVGGVFDDIIDLLSCEGVENAEKVEELDDEDVVHSVLVVFEGSKESENFLFDVFPYVYNFLVVEELAKLFRHYSFFEVGNKAHLEEIRESLLLDFRVELDRVVFSFDVKTHDLILRLLFLHGIE